MVAEELLHFIWQFRLFNQLELYSTDDEEIKIQFVGELNRDAGPDFLYARISIGGTLWTGHVELHVDGGDWVKHGHHRDAAYNNVILHVVYENSAPVYRDDGTCVPCLPLGRLLSVDVILRYKEVMHNLHWIPCERHLASISAIVKRQMLDRLAVERLEVQYARIGASYEETKGDWERVLFRQLCRSFGMKVNAEAFMQLGYLVNVSLIRKYCKEPLKIEALLFGQAGFLATAQDDYGLYLRTEFSYLRGLHGLEELTGFTWKFMRMRPANFPTFRLAQLASVYAANPYLFEHILNCKNVDDLFTILAVPAFSSYWACDYRFDQRTAQHELTLSKDFINHLVINAFVPITFAYAKKTGLTLLQDRALEWLATTKAENNAIVRAYRARGCAATSAADSQALLQLKRNYCDRKRCLSCMVGHAILKSS